MTSPPGPPDGGGPTFNNWGDSWGPQFGVVHNLTYVMPGADAPPEEQFRAGVRELNSNNRLSALRFLEKAFDAGRTPARAYYLMLAILSGQSFELLGEEHMERLRQAAAFAQEPSESAGVGGSDAYGPAIRVICQLLMLLSRPPDAVQADGRTLSAPSGIDTLPAVRRSEMLQHLQMIMYGAARDRLDAWDAAEVAEKRCAGDRRNRAPKFFMPDPVGPKQRIAAPADITGAEQVVLTASAALGSAGLVCALVVLFRGSPGTAVLVLLTLVPGAAAAAWYGMERRWLGERLAAENRRHFVTAPGHQPWHETWGNSAVPFNPAVVPGAYRIAWPNRQYEDFHADISKVVAHYFNLQFRDGEGLSAWAEHSRGVRLSLANELTIAYGGTNSVSGLEWLVAMHAEETARAWCNRTLFAYQQQLSVPLQISLPFWAGVVSFGIGALTGIGDVLSVDAGTGLWAIALLVGAGVLAGRNGYAVFARRRTHTADVQAFGLRYGNELRVWQHRLDYLADRPTDSEMAQWLDYDLRALRRESLDHYGLSHHDVRKHFFVTEANPGCDRARNLYGPPRYSSYIIRLFLLTEGGVRQHEWTMDFITASHNREDRRSFRYDAIGSVAVTQIGLRGVGPHRTVVPLRNEPPATGLSTRPADELILAQALRLSLLNSENLDIVVENFHDFINRTWENPERLSQLAFETSGVSTALRILESVAAEGRGWFAAQRASLARRLNGARLLATPDSRGLTAAPGDLNNRKPH
ncbi:hypothetical protein ACFWBM_09390 [Streptomyces sp. NPDC059980]|uniref:hypothetical protein n=1 Tax=Streptomyces sp. NPDC059980 TaxID=3347022 RepID=UPI0036BB78F5